MDYTIFTLNIFCYITYFGLDQETSVVQHHVIDISATRGKKRLNCSNYFNLVCHLLMTMVINLLSLIEGSLIDEIHHFHIKYFCCITNFYLRPRNICCTPSRYPYQRNMDKKRLYFSNYFNLVRQLS